MLHASMLNGGCRE